MRGHHSYSEPVCRVKLRTPVSGFAYFAALGVPNFRIFLSKSFLTAWRDGVCFLAIGLRNIDSTLCGRRRYKAMAANNYFQERVVFGSRKLNADEVPGRCVVCEVNPSLFAYEKQLDSHPVRKESGYCCTACALNMRFHQLLGKTASTPKLLVKWRFFSSYVFLSRHPRCLSRQ